MIGTRRAEVPMAPRRRQLFQSSLPLLQIFALLGLSIATVVTISGFLVRSSIYSTLVLASFLGIAALGQTIVVLIGGIDLSVPAVITGANLVTAMLSGRHWPFALVMAFVLVTAACVGLVNGLTAFYFRISPLIVTLATGAMVTGLALGWTRGGQVTGAVPSWLSRFSSPAGTTFGVNVPPVLVFWALLTIVVTIVLHLSVTGRRVFATGANLRAARLAGVKTGRVWLGAFTLSALAAATVGILLTGYIGTGQAGIGEPYLFSSLAAVIVGGTSLVGARGDYVRTVIGALILTLINILLVGHGAGQSTQEILIGTLILFFVGIYGRDRRVRDRV
jgi:ribose transport system permease protein